MKSLKEIIFFVAFISSPAFANAEWIKLECRDKTNFTIYFDFDEKLQSVRLADGSVLSAVISEQSIYFKATIGDEGYTHTINRSSGILNVARDASGSILSPYFCKPFVVKGRKF